MRCKRCKTTIAKGGKYCPKCGEPVAKRRKLPVVVAALALALCGAGVGLWLHMRQGLISPEQSEQPVDEPEETPAEYYLGRSKVLSSVRVADSKDVMTEAEAQKDFEARGFKDCPLTVSYDIDGTFLIEEEISGSETEKHPYYECVYVDDQNGVWVIRSYNGYVMASPISYLEETTGPEIIYAEDDHVVSYDSDAGMFYSLVPDETELVVRKVEHIDASSLKSLADEGIA